MKIKLAYGKNGLEVEIPDGNISKILRMKNLPGMPDVENNLRISLEYPVNSPPLSELAKGRKNACIVICDHTRPVPSHIILPPLLAILEDAGIKQSDIKILIATGIHRPSTEEEIIRLVGEDIAKNYRIINHKSTVDEDHTFLGETAKGTPVYVNSEYINSDLKILAGFIEPHLMAGFSGGRKLICPGISSIKTVKVVHSPLFLEDKNCREGIIYRNPFHEEATGIAKMAGVDFTVNVTLNEHKIITGIFAGDLETSHKMGTDFDRSAVGDSVEEPADIVVTTSGGFPLDATFYQAVKGLTAAMPAVKEGGTIILAAECSEGLGSSEFVELLTNMDSIEDFDRRIISGKEFYIDQWQIEELVKVLRKLDVILVSENIPEKFSGKILVEHSTDFNDALDSALQKHGNDSKIAVIPEGPYVLCEVRE